MTLNGIDISNWQAGINLSVVPGDFVIVKATEGTTYVSPEADVQYQGAKSTGKLLGVYHFATGASAIDEAKFFLSNVQGYLGEAILFLDWEAGVVTQGVGYAKAFLDYVYQQTGIRPLIYMSKSVVNSYDWSTVSENYGLWVAQYADSMPTGYQSNPWTDDNGFGTWSGPAIFQYASTGRLSGYSGNLDLDMFYGDATAWNNFAKSDKVTPEPEPEPDPEPEPTTGTPIVQYADPDGNKAYAYTHWQAIEGKPDVALKSDLPVKTALKTVQIKPLIANIPNINIAWNDKLVTLSMEGNIPANTVSIIADTVVAHLPQAVTPPWVAIWSGISNVSNASRFGGIRVLPNGEVSINMTQDQMDGSYFVTSLSWPI